LRSPFQLAGVEPLALSRFPARKTLEEFDFTFQRSVKKTQLATSRMSGEVTLAGSAHVRTVAGMRLLRTGRGSPTNARRDRTYQQSAC
jgi:hypothetical protein